MTTKTKQADAPLFGDEAKVATKERPAASPAPKVAPATKPVAVRQAKQKTGQQVTVHQPAQQRSLAEAIIEASRDPSVDVPKLKELLAMAREEQARAAEREYNDAMLKAQSKMPRIVKDGRGAHNMPYAKLESLSQQVDPIAHEHGFVLSFGMSDSPIDAHYRIICDVMHSGGHTRHYYADIGSATTGAKGGGVMSPAQGSGAVISFGRRYIKVMIFDLVILGEDIDAVGNPVGPLSDAETKQLLTALEFKGITEDQFRAAYLCAPKDLPKRRLQEALDRIAQAAPRKRIAGAKDETQ